jgi:hypothetical protein
MILEMMIFMTATIYFKKTYPIQFPMIYLINFR